MSNFKNLEGLSFGGWTVLKDTLKRSPTMFLCKCDCGRVFEVRSGDLLNGSSKSCKHCSNETHKLSKTRIYQCWQDMIYIIELHCFGPVLSNMDTMESI